MPKLFSRSESFFCQLESTFGIIPNTSGSATVAGADGMAAIQFKMNRTVDEIFRRDKTGSRTRTAGVAGRRMADWNCNASIVTGGTPGTLPDHDPIYRSVFGGAATVTSGTVTITAASNASPIVITAAAHGLSNFDCVSITGVVGNTAANGIWAVNNVTTNTFELVGSVGNGAWVSGGTVSKAGLFYKPTDAEPSFCVYSARVPIASGSQRVVAGAVAKEFAINLGDDIATFTASGPAKWTLDNLNFSSATIAERCGLTSFPNMATPVAALTLLGTAIAGFKGRAVINGVTQAKIRTASLKYSANLDLPRDLFGTDYVDDPEADERAVSVDFNMYEEDSASQAALEQAAVDKSNIDMVFQMGTVVGSTIICILRGVHLSSPDRDDGQRAFTMNYSGSPAFGTASTAFNEMRMWMM